MGGIENLLKIFYFDFMTFLQETVDVAPKKEVKGTQGLHQVVLQKTVSWEGVSGNTIAYSSITGDVTACDQQYTK